MQGLERYCETCRISAIKHLKDGDTENLRWRIEKTLTDLRQLTRELVEDSLTGAAKFLRNSANYLVAFARLAMKQVRIPYTNNLIERLVGEIVKRVKNKRMRWSATGLENMLNIILVRYCNRRLYEELKGRYLSREKETLIRIRIE